MKKQLLILALLITGVVSARAQAMLGIKGGVNFSKINTDNLKESNVTGYQVGLYGRIGNSWYLQPELYLGSRGGKFETSNNTTDAKVTFTTLNVPLLVGRKLVSIGSFNIRAMAGPIYSYNLSKDIDFKGAVQDFGSYKNSTLGFQAGGGIDIGNLTADLRYEGGLTKINERYGQRANLWALSVGFKIL
ncbi:PorT family protein [Mucilaginibacter sp. Bleaf8]|uniref:porin family protein n=1 Tax=Mucilaginibacter sp. Bleaf8 TaxID=2834430 RepID=UPI001BCB6C53|nr:porin family protein [Mucilaginibacter sp. Bleaf8]MBS7565817.1 PorT family protein [Mucilaginibacter sp. Bleaf8]